MQNHTETRGTMQNHTKPYKTTRNHAQPQGTTQNQSEQLMGTYRNFRNIKKVLQKKEE